MDNNDINGTIGNDPMLGLEREEVMMTDYFNRRRHSMPDVQMELKAFKRRHGIGIWHSSRPIMATLMAAAAVVLVVFFIKPWNSQNEANVNNDKFVAYNVQTDVPTNITISVNGKESAAPKGMREFRANSSNAKSIVYTTLKTPAQMTAEMELTDGTIVLLNSCSQLRYPSRFADGERRVEVKGEAYFRVKHDSGHPFVVVANGLTTTVTGTEFNVRAYNDISPAITLVEGSVEVNPTGSNDVQKIIPGQHAKLDDSGKLTIRNVDTYIYTAWTEDKFYFDNATLYDIACELGQWYNISVVFDNPKLMNIRLFMTADRSDDIGELVESLNMMKKAKISLQNNQIVIR